MSTNSNNTWEEMRQHYKILDLTIDRRPPYYDLEGNRRHGVERIELDFGSPDIDFAGETKIEYFMRMMAASPDMLEVLEELDESAYYWSQYDVPVGIHDRIKSAIAKAKGESHE
jgi:hypothetical protein